jgi:hypothetical protein
MNKRIAIDACKINFAGHEKIVAFRAGKRKEIICISIAAQYSSTYQLTLSGQAVDG